MTDRPIIFSKPMIIALLHEAREAGTGKSMTRRLYYRGLKKPDSIGRVRVISPWVGVKPDDRLWVRENLMQRRGNFLGIPQNVVEAAYVADGEDVVEAHGFNVLPWWKGKGDLPSIHMPRWASRLTLVVTATKTERLQDIGETDCEREGVRWSPKTREWSVDDPAGGAPFVRKTAIECFAELWCARHGDSAWKEDPEVVALSFSVARANVDSKEAA